MAQTILIADDESTLRSLCAEALQEAGYQVLEAADGQEALNILHEHKVDLVISDMRMPRLDGMALLERISKEKLDVDFLVMTGFGTIETAVEIMKKGALDYLPKPFDFKHLLLKVEKAFQERAQRKEKEDLNNLVKILKLSQDLNKHLEFQTLLNEFVFHLERNFSPSSVGLFLKNDSSELQLLRVRGRLLHADAMLVNLMKRLCQLILRRKKALLVDPYVISSDPELAFLQPLVKSRYSVMAAPLLGKRGGLGALVLIRDQQKEMYLPDELQLLAVFASQSVSSIENARLYGRLRSMNEEIIKSFAQAVEAKDVYTRGHSERVAYYGATLGKKLSLTQDEIDQLYLSGIVHDIGKIGVPDKILNKPDKLTDDEFEVMKTHPVIGRSILAQVKSLSNILPIIYHHHEQVDGSGYPEGLNDGQIPFLARVISVVDGFEAMTSNRAYRNALPFKTVFDILEKGAGKQWESDLVYKWLEVVEEEKIGIGA